MLTALLGVVCLMAPDIVQESDSTIVEQVLHAKLSSNALSANFKHVAPRFHKGNAASPLGESVRHRYKSEVVRSPNGRFASVYIAVDLDRPSCLLVLYDMKARRPLWVNVSSEFPADIVGRKESSQPMERYGLYFTDKGRLVIVNFGGTIARLDDIDTLRRERFDRAVTIVDWDEVAGDSDTLNIDNISVRFKRTDDEAQSEFEILRDGVNLNVGVCGFTK